MQNSMSMYLEEYDRDHRVQHPILSPASFFQVQKSIGILVKTLETFSTFGPRQANLCLRTFRHDKFQLRMPSHSEKPGIWLSV